jgi:DNA primase
MYVDKYLENFNIVEFLNNNGYKTKFMGGATQYITTCPFCGKERHLGVNPEKKTFGCYKCRIGGSFFKLIQQVYGKGFNETLEFIKSGLDDRKFDISFLNNMIDEGRHIDSLILNLKPISLPEGYIPLNDNRISYLDKRGVTQDQIRYYRMGICTTGLYKNRLIICDVNEKQEIIYWIARDMTGRVAKQDKVWNPNSEKVGVGSSDLIFNFFLAKNYSVGIITEGVFDALWVGNNGMATYGKGLKQNHLYWIFRAGFEKIVLLYDADVIYNELSECARRLSIYTNVAICQLEKGDPDEYPKDILTSLINNAPLFTNSNLDLKGINISETF